MSWWNEACQTSDADFVARAQERQGQLTKPPGALGTLEEIAIRLAGLQQNDQPAVDNVHISVFAADHGVAWRIFTEEKTNRPAYFFGWFE